MERRKFLIGAGGTAVGASALVGSGAFTRAEADRGVSLTVSNDDTDPALKFETKDNHPANDGDRSLYANVVGGNLEVDLATEGGMNVNASFLYRNVVQIQNTSNNLDLLLGIDVSDIEASDSIDDIDVFVSDSNTSPESDFASITDTLDFDGTDYGPSIVNDDADAAVGAGESVWLHIYIETTGDDEDLDFDASFGAVDRGAYGTG